MVPRTTKYQPRRHQRQNQRSRQQVFVGLAIAACLIFTKVWQKVNVDHQLRRNGALEQELLTLRGENALLEVKIDELRSMQRMGDMTGKSLNLVPVPTINLQEKSILDKLADKLEDWQR
jgi:hypothetical protein